MGVMAKRLVVVQRAAANSSHYEPAEHELQRSAFAWIPQEHQDEADQVISARQVVREFGVPVEVLMTSLDAQISQAEAFRHMPFTLLLVIAYGLVIITHDNAPAVNAVEDSMSFKLAENAKYGFSNNFGFKKLEDVVSFDDFWSWLSEGYMPLVFANTRGYSEDLESTWLPKNVSLPEQEAYGVNSPLRGLFIGRNRIVGGVRLSQEVADGNLSCKTNPDLIETYGLPCDGGTKYELDPEMWIARKTSNSDRKRVKWFYVHQDLQEILAQVLKMEGSDWLDARTMKVEIAMPAYNGEYGLHTAVYVNFFFSRGGQIWKTVIPLSVLADWHDSWEKYFFDALFCCCLLWLLYSESRLAFHAFCAKSVFAKRRSSYAKLSTVLDWLSILHSGVIILMFALQLTFVSDLNDSAAALGSMSPDADDHRRLIASRTYQTKLEAYIDQLEKNVDFCHTFRLVMAAYPGIIIFRLFKSFAAQPRLAVVTRSLSASAVDLLHFLVVFASIFGIYAIMGVGLFGRSLDNYAHMGRTYSSLFLAMVGGFEWSEISAAGRAEAGVYAWTFAGLVTLMMLNMLIAIVMDSYSEVKSEAGVCPTLWRDTKDTWTRIMAERRGEKVQITEVKACILQRIADLKQERNTLKDRQNYQRAMQRTLGAHHISDEDLIDDAMVDEEKFKLPQLKAETLCDLVRGLRNAHAVPLKVCIESIRGLEGDLEIVECRPFCVCKLVSSDASKESKRVKDSCTTGVLGSGHIPVWNFTSLLQQYHANDALVFEVFSYDRRLRWKKDHALLGKARLGKEAIRPHGFSGELVLIDRCGMASNVKLTVKVTLPLSQAKSLLERACVDYHRTHRTVTTLEDLRKCSEEVLADIEHWEMDAKNMQDVLMVGGESVGDLTHGWRRTMAALRDEFACEQQHDSGFSGYPMAHAGRLSIDNSQLTTRQPKRGQAVASVGTARESLAACEPISDCDVRLADWPTAQDAAERVRGLELELVAVREDVARELSAISDMQWHMREVQDQISALKAKAFKLSARAATLSRKNRVLKANLPKAAHRDADMEWDSCNLLHRLPHVQRVSCERLVERGRGNEGPLLRRDSRTMGPAAQSAHGVPRRSVK